VAPVNRVHYEKGTRQRVSHDCLNNAHFHLNLDYLARAGLFFAERKLIVSLKVRAFVLEKRKINFLAFELELTRRHAFVSVF
jgi:hypothetical protein